MDVKNSYPYVKRRFFTIGRLRSWLFWLFAAVFLACFIVNICVGGKPWCLYVLGGELLLWMLVVDLPLIENSWLDWATSALLGSAAYLVLLDVCGGLGGWSRFVVPVLCFALLIVQGTLFFVFFRSRRINSLPMYFLIVAGLWAILGAILGLNEMNWPTIVLGSLSLALLLVSFIIFRGDLLRELKKRFHLR